MITTYGVGSMVAIADQSYIIGGLDSWSVNDALTIYEPRLQHWLRVDAFKLPPAADPPSGDGVRVRIFPEMYSCPGCNELKRFREFGCARGKSLCPTCDRQLIPSRFVVACQNGHLDDFPYFQWVHKKTAPTESQDRRHEMSLHSTGRTASLRAVIVRCSCGKEASLEGAFGRLAMQVLGIACSGRRPWLGRGSEEKGCTAVPRTLQRGASAAWFPVNRSALSIPPWSETLQKRLNPHFKVLSSLVESGAPDDVIIATINGAGILKGTRFSAEEFLDAVRRRMELAGSIQPDSEEGNGFEPAAQLRREEYEQLLYGTASSDRYEDFECGPPNEDSDHPLPDGLAKTMLVNRLREVRALQSFTRLEAPDTRSKGDGQAAMFNSGAVIDWLPAIEVSGEGVFLTLDQNRLREWETQPGPMSRASRIRDNHTEELRRRAASAQDKMPISKILSPIKARYVLLHTLAHALINEWSLDSGYPAAALRERLYAAEDMAGILIYTATSDSAGSLGGVVAQGEYKRLRASVESALARISWCSQDPPCMESEASGTGSLNLAACYACVLLPETSCETNNTFLDRAMLIGTLDQPAIGFFSGRS